MSSSDCNDEDSLSQKSSERVGFGGLKAQIKKQQVEEEKKQYINVGRKKEENLEVIEEGERWVKLLC